MKKIFFLKVIFLSMLIMLMALSAAIADQVVLYSQGNYSNGSGGEFTAKIAQTSTGPDLDLNWAYYADNTRDIGDYDPSFQTFCVEYGEYFYSGVPYYVTISDSAFNGGVGSGGDPISLGTAWLYYQFATGTLGNYNYGSDRSTSAGYLQDIIWYLEGEVGAITNPAANPFDDMLTTKFESIGNAEADNNGTYSVAVLNLYDSKGGLRQDQLVLVPEPSTLLLLGAGLLGLGLLGRKKFKARG